MISACEQAAQKPRKAPSKMATGRERQAWAHPVAAAASTPEQCPDRQREEGGYPGDRLAVGRRLLLPAIRMKTVTLGQSQLTSSRLAYGCWRIATKGDAAADYAAAKAAIFAAIDAGYTLFDHADRTFIATAQRSASSAGS